MPMVSGTRTCSAPGETLEDCLVREVMEEG